MPARPVRMRQDHDAAPDRGFRRTRWRRDPGRRPPDFRARRERGAGAAQHVDDLPELRAVAAHDRVRKRRLRAAAARPARQRHPAPRRHHPGGHEAQRAGAALSRRTVGRAAAARVAGARAGDRTGDPAAGRAAVEPGRQPARRDALRNPAPARQVPLHHGVRHARPGRSDDHGEPDRGDEPGRDRAGRLARGHLPATAHRIRGPLHRRHQHLQGPVGRQRHGRLRPRPGAALRIGRVRAARATPRFRSGITTSGSQAPSRTPRRPTGSAAPSRARSISARTGTTSSRWPAARRCAPSRPSTSRSGKARPSGCTSRRNIAARWRR